MTNYDKLILALLKEALSRTELSAEQQKSTYESLTRAFEPTSLRIFITSTLSVYLKEIVKKSELLNLRVGKHIALN